MASRIPCLTDGGGACLMMWFHSNSVGIDAENRFSADVRLQLEAGRTPYKEFRLGLSREERCPEM